MNMKSIKLYSNRVEVMLPHSLILNSIVVYYRIKGKTTPKSKYRIHRVFLLSFSFIDVSFYRKKIQMVVMKII